MELRPTAAGPRKAFTNLEVASIKAAGRHSIGDGLILVVNASGNRSWLARVRDPRGKRRDLGLGRYPDVSLKEARARAADFRRLVRDGLDPVVEKRRAQRTVPTFWEAAQKVHAERAPGFKNAKHAAQWLQSLREYVRPAFGSSMVDQINGPLIVEALKPIWTSKPETARRVLQRVAAVLAWSVAHGFRENEAPLQAIKMGLPRQTKPTVHFTAVPYAEAPAFFRRLLSLSPSVSRDALLLIILTAVRSGEARGARWEEFDLDTGVWTIPADRMKMGKPHVVPLSANAVSLLRKRLTVLEHADFVFASAPNKPISSTAVAKIMRTAGSDATIHGWRSTFRDWGAEETHHMNEVLEQALAHQIRNAVERSYRRGNLFDKRRELMADWCEFLTGGDRMEHSR